MKKELAIIGLGKMGGNMALRLRERGWKVLGLDKGHDFSKIKGLACPRVIIFSIPAQAVDQVIGDILKLLEKRDFIADFGNSFYKASVRRARQLQKKGIRFVDVGISGGPGSVVKRGACLMVGGKKKDFDYLNPLFRDIAAKNSMQFFEGAGAGHFMKMIHNGIEYGMMQSLAEGFTILRKSKYRPDLESVANIYNHGSIIEARLVGWLSDAIKRYGENFEGVSGTVRHTGEGAWTVKTAKEMGIDVKVLSEAFNFRIHSVKNPSWTGKLLSALRSQFGGHSAKT